MKKLTLIALFILTCSSSFADTDVTRALRIGTPIRQATEGSVITAGPGGVISQDNANFFWDDTSNYLRVPTIIGGSATTQDLTFQTTSGVGAAGADMHFLVGNNGATEAMTILNSGFVGIGQATPLASLHVTLSEPSIYLQATRADDPRTYYFKANYEDAVRGTELVFGDTVLGARMVIDNDGKVGIGTTAPTAGLSVVGTLSDTLGSGVLSLGPLSGSIPYYNFRIYDTGGSTGNALALDTTNGGVSSNLMVWERTSSKVGIGIAVPNAMLNISADTAAVTDILNVVSRDSASIFMVDRNKRVGVGTATPTVSLDVVGSFRTAPFTLTDAATIETDASRGNFFTVTLGGNRTLGTPTNPINGQKIMYIISQDATGSRTLSYSPAFRFGTTITSPTLTTTPGSQDYLGFVYNARGTVARYLSWDAVAVAQGYSS